MRTATRFSLTSKITLAVSLLVTVYLCAIALVGQIYFEKKFKESISNQQFTLVSALADEIDQKLLAAQGELTAVAHTIDLGLADTPEAIQLILDRRIDTQLIFDNGLYFFSSSGVLETSTPMQTEILGKDFSSRDYLQKTLKTGEPQISEPFFSDQSHHHPILMFTAPMFDHNGHIKGILSGSIDLLKDNFLGRIPDVNK
ncbi:PDC sensor domain-containing protein, partial [Trichloromonas sp.]|uniref:PDC sensor domain-containing protein n=1 Tax=Trichloromonas sp. TaxID=3069249 RepID=UPI003D81AFD9